MERLAESLNRILRRAQAEGAQCGEVVGDGDGLYLKAFSGTVINIDGRGGRRLRREDVEAVRAALTEIGYAEVDSWIPRQGVSWLSDGVSAGVSFRIARRPRRVDPPGSWPDDPDFPYGPKPTPKPLISDETIAEAAAMAERDRLAGGPPWEVEDHPDNRLPGGWHHGQITGTPAPGWES